MIIKIVAMNFRSKASIPGKSYYQSLMKKNRRIFHRFGISSNLCFMMVYMALQNDNEKNSNYHVFKKSSKKHRIFTNRPTRMGEGLATVFRYISYLTV